MTARLAIALAIAAISATAFAGDAPSRALSVDECIAIAAKEFKVDPLPLRILRRTEAGREGLAMQNKNGTYDLGPMQINTVNLDQFTAFGITYDDLLWNRNCTNVFAATYLFKRHLVDQRGDVGMAMAHYHNRLPEYGARYLELVQKAIEAERRDQQARASRVATGAQPTPNP